RLERTMEAEVSQRIHAGRPHQVDVASLAPVAAVRPAERNEFLTAKAHGAASAVTGLNPDDCFVYETHGKKRLTCECQVGKFATRRRTAAPNVTTRRHASCNLTPAPKRSPGQAGASRVWLAARRSVRRDDA